MGSLWGPLASTAIGRFWGKLESAGRSWGKLESAGRSWNKPESAGTFWGKPESAGTFWGKPESASSKVECSGIGSSLSASQSFLVAFAFDLPFALAFAFPFAWPLPFPLPLPHSEELQRTTSNIMRESHRPQRCIQKAFQQLSRCFRLPSLGPHGRLLFEDFHACVVHAHGLKLGNEVRFRGLHGIH